MRVSRRRGGIAGSATPHLVWPMVQRLAKVQFSSTNHPLARWPTDPVTWPTVKLVNGASRCLRAPRALRGYPFDEQSSNHGEHGAHGEKGVGPIPFNGSVTTDYAKVFSKNGGPGCLRVPDDRKSGPLPRPAKYRIRAHRCHSLPETLVWTKRKASAGCDLRER